MSTATYQTYHQHADYGQEAFALQRALLYLPEENNRAAENARRFIILNFQGENNRLEDVIQDLLLRLQRENVFQPFPLYRELINTQSNLPIQTLSPLRDFNSPLTTPNANPLSTETTVPVNNCSEIAYREEVPFERYAIDQENYSKQKFSGLKCRLISALHTLEGVVKLVAEAATTAFKKMIEATTDHKFQISSDAHKMVMEAQARGLKYSAYAVISSAKARAAAEKDKKIGCSVDSWKWGTPYKGDRTLGIFEAVYDDSKKDQI